MPLNRIAAGALALLCLYASPASAQDALIVLIDRSGSMLGSGSPSGTPNWDIALDQARDRVSVGPPNRAYELWTYSGSSYTRHVSFSDGAGLSDGDRRNLMVNAIDALSGPSSLTPLALTVCDAVDGLINWASGSTTFPPPLLHISIYSDGLENSTPAGTQCAGPNSATTYDDANPIRGGLTPSSWQWKVLNKAITGSPTNQSNTPAQVIFDATVLLTNFLPTFSPTSAGGDDVAEAGHAFAPSSFSPTSSGFDFFEGLARETGGKYVVIDSARPPPVLGDINGDRCVNNADFYALLAVYGQPVNPSNIDADLNRNQVVDYGDYVTLLQNFGSGVCP